VKIPSLATIARTLAIGSIVLLSGCKHLEVLDPKGAIGMQEKNLLLIATGLMLLVIVPVIIMIIAFAWRYRASNTKATYAPRWAHSTAIEVVVWAIPCVIIAILATLTWTSTHELDPYKPIESKVKPIHVDVVAMDWKWLFIYPDYGIATVNQMAMPVGTPVSFNITSTTVMNSFFIPQLGSQVYAMSGMQTKLHLIADVAGTYDGISANYSGAGFSGMRFKAIATTQQGFDDWIAKVRAANNPLTPETYAALDKPSENNPVTYYSSTPPSMFAFILHSQMAKIAGETSPVCTPTSHNLVASAE
jgi:cytochrome o ubiquinol oxidase subunit 2